jgi:ABC-type nitrate/sulfonate/bicarbonate transport system permease component
VAERARRAGWSTAGRRPRIGPALSRVPINAWRVVVFALLILVWWGLSVAAGGAFVPTPLATWEAAVKMIDNGTLLKATLESLQAYFVGYLVAAAVAIPLGLVMGGFRVFGATIEVYMNALSATPRVAFIPLIIIFLGLGFQSKVMIIFLGAVMPILINTYAGVLNSDGELIEMARSTGASEFDIFRKVMLPGALRYIVAGLRVGAGIGLINTVVAELYTAVRGLGGLLAVYGNTFQMAPYFVVVIVFAIIGVAVTQALKLVEMRMDRWQYQIGSST